MMAAWMVDQLESLMAEKWVVVMVGMLEYLLAEQMAEKMVKRMVEQWVV